MTTTMMWAPVFAVALASAASAGDAVAGGAGAGAAVDIPTSDDPPTVIAADAARGVVVLAIAEDLFGSPDIDLCDMKDFGGKGARIEVVRLDDTSTDASGPNHRSYHIASLYPPCMTKASAQQAHVKARADILAKDGVDIDKKPRPLITKGKPKLTTVRTDDDGLFSEVGRWSFSVGGVPVLGDAYNSGNGAGNMQPEVVDIWHVDDSDLYLELDSFGSMRGTGWRYVLWRLATPANGVDVAALTSVAAALPKTCQVSVVASQSVVHDVAVTVAASLGDAPLAQAKAERPTSIVYAAPACMDAARGVAAKIKGGAGVEALTWKSSRAIVVALGNSAATANPGMKP